MLQGANAARGDDRHRNSGGYNSIEREIVSLLCAIAIHTCEQDFACAQSDALLRPFYNIHTGGCTSSVDEYLVSARLCRIGTRINGKNHTLCAKLLRTGTEQAWVLYCCCIDGSL